jgi:YD repeat-containing protein
MALQATVDGFEYIPSKNQVALAANPQMDGKIQLNWNGTTATILNASLSEDSLVFTAPQAIGENYVQEYISNDYPGLTLTGDINQTTGAFDSFVLRQAGDDSWSTTYTAVTGPVWPATGLPRYSYEPTLTTVVHGNVVTNTRTTYDPTYDLPTKITTDNKGDGVYDEVDYVYGTGTFQGFVVSATETVYNIVAAQDIFVLALDPNGYPTRTRKHFTLSAGSLTLTSAPVSIDVESISGGSGAVTFTSTAEPDGVTPYSTVAKLDPTTGLITSQTTPTGAVFNLTYGYRAEQDPVFPLPLLVTTTRAQQPTTVVQLQSIGNDPSHKSCLATREYEIVAGAAAESPPGTETLYGGGINGKLETYSASNDVVPLSFGTTTTYNEFGLVATVGNPNSGSAAYTYDEWDRLISEVDTDASGNVINQSYYSYTPYTSATGSSTYPGFTGIPLTSSVTGPDGVTSQFGLNISLDPSGLNTMLTSTTRIGAGQLLSKSVTVDYRGSPILEVDPVAGTSVSNNYLATPLGPFLVTRTTQLAGQTVDVQHFSGTYADSPFVSASTETGQPNQSGITYDAVNDPTGSQSSLGQWSENDSMQWSPWAIPTTTNSTIADPGATRGYASTTSLYPGSQGAVTGIHTTVTTSFPDGNSSLLSVGTSQTITPAPAQ